MDNSFKNRFDCNIEKWLDYRIELDKYAIQSFIEANLEELKVCYDMGIFPEIAIKLVK